MAFVFMANAIFLCAFFFHFYVIYYIFIKGEQFIE